MCVYILGYSFIDFHFSFDNMELLHDIAYILLLEAVIVFLFFVLFLFLGECPVCVFPWVRLNFNQNEHFGIILIAVSNGSLVFKYQ